MKGFSLIGKIRSFFFFRILHPQSSILNENFCALLISLAFYNRFLNSRALDQRAFYARYSIERWHHSLCTVQLECIISYIRVDWSFATLRKRCNFTNVTMRVEIFYILDLPQSKANVYLTKKILKNKDTQCILNIPKSSSVNMFCRHYNSNASVCNHSITRVKSWHVSKAASWYWISE